MSTSSISGKATKEISLALTTKLFDHYAKKVSVGKVVRGQWSSSDCFTLEVGQISGRQCRMDNNKKNTRERSRSPGTYTVVLLVARQGLLKEPQGKFHSFTGHHLREGEVWIIYLVFSDTERYMDYKCIFNCIPMAFEKNGFHLLVKT